MESNSDFPLELGELYTVYKHPEYLALIAQLNKDIIRTGMTIDFSSELQPDELFQQVFKALLRTLEGDSNKFATLMYLADVNGDSFTYNNFDDLNSLAKIGTVLLLLREYQKIKTRAALKNHGEFRNKPG